MRRLILASSSPYRRALLEKLRLPFETASPHINEEGFPGESASALATRLATEKARALCDRFPDALIIGSDQVAECQDRQLGKPGTHEKAVEQLLFCAGHPVTFHTGLCLMDSSNATHTTICEPFRVHFKKLSKAEAERYVELENPVDCAGSFKAESLGIALFEKMEGNDPNSLVGLPLIRLIDLLQAQGITPLDQKMPKS